MRPSASRAASLCVAVTVTGAILIVLGELTDLLESELGLNWVNVSFALPVALIAVAAVAVGGDMLLEAIERRRGRRPGHRLATPMLAGLGSVAAIEIAIHHVRHAPHLDASLGLAGGTLLLIAAGLHRYGSATAQSSSPTPSGNRARPHRRALAGFASLRVRRARRRASDRSTASS